MLGTDEYTGSGKMCSGVFEESVVQRIDLPSTLRKIEYGAFRGCRGLKSIQLPDGLEAIGRYCFYKSGLEKLVLPKSVREIGVRAFRDCAQLKSVRLNEGLERLG